MQAMGLLHLRKRRLRKVRRGQLASALAIFLFVLGVLAPVLPSGVDIYAHLLWMHQVARCLRAGELPAWAPDLNAGFGAPGIRLYSPAPEVVGGVFALLSGDAAAGVRAAILLSILAIVLASKRAGGNAVWFLILISPVFWRDLLYQSAIAQVAAMGAALWVLELWVGENNDDAPALPIASLGFGLLWLLHALTWMMVSALTLLAAILSNNAKKLLRWFSAMFFGMLLTSWHWLPLLSEASFVNPLRISTSGEFDVGTNYLGSPFPYAPKLSSAMSINVIIMALIAGLLVLRGTIRSSRHSAIRLSLVLASLSMTTIIIVPISSLITPLKVLQYPWRWVGPACLLLAPMIARTKPLSLRLMLGIAWGLPLVWLPLPHLMRTGKLSPDQGWPEISAFVASFGGNPFCVAVFEERPPWYHHLAEEIAIFGPQKLVVTAPTKKSSYRVLVWTPLYKKVEVRLHGNPSLVGLRVFRYPFWEAKVDGISSRLLERGAACWLALPAGEHTVELRWGGNPLTAVGLSAALATLLGWLLVVYRKRWAAAAQNKIRHGR